jgi:N utilization substance protein B
MASRRQIREAVVQFLYCADLEGGADPTGLREPFWDFVTESDRRSLQVATFRTVIHLAHGRTSRLHEFQLRLPPAAAHLSAWPQAEPLQRELQRIAELETAWTAAFEALERLPRDQEEATVAENFTRGLAVFFQLDRDLAATRQRFLEGLDDFPTLRGQLEAVAASVRRLQRVSDRLRMVEEPEKFPEQGDLAKLRDSKAAIRALRQKADQLVDAVLANKDAIDATLATVVENFSPERIDPVDRAVLRLATYELQLTTTPAKVIINEAVELAKRFGTTDSHRFVNGVLDRIAKSKATTRPPTS